MGLSAQDVHDMQFKLVRQSTGYDIDEVDAFLDQVEEEITRLTAELDAARALASAQPPAKPERTEPEPPDEPGLTSAPGAPEPLAASAEGAARILALAQRTADEYSAEARRSADALVAEARSTAEQLVTQGRERSRAELDALEARRADLEARVGALRTFESEVRTRLTSYFQGQLQDLRAVFPQPEAAQQEPEAAQQEPEAHAEG